MHMQNLTVHVGMVYNECRSGYQKFLIPTDLFTNLEILRSQGLASKLARLVLITWLIDLNDPFYSPKFKRVNEPCRSTGYRKSLSFLHYILPCDRNFDYVEAIYLYLYLFKINSHNSSNLINKGA